MEIFTQFWSYSTDFFSVVRDAVPFIAVLLFLYLLSMFMFWFESRSVKKNPNSVFDMWFFMTIVMILWGRVSYIVTNWASFNEWNFFWLPYERYGEALYVFRAMPWRLFRIWDGGFLFIPMLFTYVLTGFLYTVFIKKWRWKDMFPSVLFSSNFLLGTTLFVYGFYLENRDISMDGFLIIIFIAVSQILLNLLKYIYRNNSIAYERISNLYLSIFVIANSAFLYYTFLRQDISQFEIYHVYGYVILVILLLIAYLLDISNPEKRTDDSSISTTPSVNLNQVVRIRDERSA